MEKIICKDPHGHNRWIVNTGHACAECGGTNIIPAHSYAEQKEGAEIALQQQAQEPVMYCTHTLSPATISVEWYNSLSPELKADFQPLYSAPQRSGYPVEIVDSLADLLEDAQSHLHWFEERCMGATPDEVDQCHEDISKVLTLFNQYKTTINGK